VVISKNWSARILAEGVSYAEAVKKVATCSKVSDSRRREAESPPPVAYVTEQSVVVTGE